MFWSASARSAASAGRDRCRDSRTAPSAPAAAPRGLRRARAPPACRDRRRRARSAKVTGAGSLASASAVPVALMPSPPITMAMRGASASAGRQLRAAGVERRRPRAVRRRSSGSRRGARSPAALVDRRLRGAWRSAPLELPGIDHLLALAAGAVDDGDGLAAGRRRGRPWRGAATGAGSALSGGRAVVAGMLLAVAAAPAWPGVRLGCLVATTADRLAAERIVDEHRPGARPASAEQPEHAGQHLRRGDGQLRQASCVCSGRAGRSGHPVPRPQILANHRSEV